MIPSLDDIPKIKSMATEFTNNKKATSKTVVGHFCDKETNLDMVDTCERLHALGIRKKLPEENQDLFLAKWFELYPNSISPDPKQLWPIFYFVSKLAPLGGIERLPPSAFVDQVCSLL
jgi:hypothetical protein